MKKKLQIPFSIDLTKSLQDLKSKKVCTLVNVGNAAAKSFIVSQLLKKSHQKFLFWASLDEKVENLELNSRWFFDEKIKIIPQKLEMADYYRLINCVHSDQKHLFLFEDFEATMEQKLPPVEVIKAHKLDLETGMKNFHIYEFFEKLEKFGYKSAEDGRINPGEFVKKGDQLFVFPINSEVCFRIDLFDKWVEKIETYPQLSDKNLAKGKKTLENDLEQKPETVTYIEIYPIVFEEPDLTGRFFDFMNDLPETIFVADDIDSDDLSAALESAQFSSVKFTTFPKEEDSFFHLNFFSVLPFYTIPDFVLDIKERFRKGYDIVVLTKKAAAVREIFDQNNIFYTNDLECKNLSTVKLVSLDKNDFMPHSFQNSTEKILFLTDREIFQFHRSQSRKNSISGMNLELLNSLKTGDFVVHLNHGIGIYQGMIRRELHKGEFREYLKLEYLNNDKLFIPVESAEKVIKYIGDSEPKLTRLGGGEWQALQSKLKQQAEKIAKELLELYAKRKLSKGRSFTRGDQKLETFCNDFPYELTPGQKQAWNEVHLDMKSDKTMDRLVCGDVGFGKTEIAMRAAFQAYCSGFQCAILSPITILAEQHYESFVKRIGKRDYGIRIGLISRFQSPAEQKKVLRDLELGLIDIIIGTHRLLSADVKFKNLGLLVIDEEQRFGVNQKEILKKMKVNLDMLTLTATPIPRTLHMGLNKLKDISTITTPPPGRLPVITEVRRYSLDLIRERILFEVKRGGQVYFLHNEVRTIESQAEQMRQLMPEVRFLVAHGQMKPQDLEAKIHDFKDKKADVLIASTIIENGIDLSNANTLLVNRSEKFGISQLYQLRGRVGRSTTQAYAFFLYQGQKLSVDARKRLRAIVEASELGAGFQIAMRDLEIRGAGEILGSNQAGTMKDVGVSHFIRMLNKTMEEMKNNNVSLNDSEEENVVVEVPLSSFIPVHYIPHVDEKIRMYQTLAGASEKNALEALKKELREDYGNLPVEVENLCRVIEFKISLKAVNCTGLSIRRKSHKSYELILVLGKNFKPEQIFGLIQKGKYKWTVTAKALRLELEKLPVAWWEKILGEIRCLELGKIPPEKKA